MRLSEQYIDTLKQSFKDIFISGNIYLFGSRVDDSKKGGDIDLYIVPAKVLSAQERFDKKLAFLLIVKEKLGEQKIDVIVSKDLTRSIEVEAMRTGIKL